MSGPKVFHVVTREELIARCEAHLRRLDAAIAEWKKAFEQIGAADGESLRSVTDRRDEFRRMLNEGRFAGIQKQVPAEISFLRSDAQTRTERAAAAAAQAAQNRRRTARTARMLLEALGKEGRGIPADLRNDLQASNIPDSAIARAFALLAPDQIGNAATERQRQIASELGRDEKRATLAEWLARQPASTERELDLRIDQHLAELTALGVDPSPFSARANAIAEAPESRQDLLVDSLVVELAQAVRGARTRAAQLADLRQRISELANIDTATARNLQDRMAAAVTTEDTSTAAVLIAEANVLLEDALRALAADARRREVLKGLASLGYEVTEGMATAWVQGGQVVLRKAANPGYGVELGGGTKSERLQVRAVAFGAGSARDASRDRDMETVWCSEFERLRTLFASSGGGIEIEHALAVGATPLKVIEDASREEADTVRAPKTFQS